MAPAADSRVSMESGYCSMTARYTKATSGSHNRHFPYNGLRRFGIADDPTTEGEPINKLISKLINKRKKKKEQFVSM